MDLILTTLVREHQTVWIRSWGHEKCAIPAEKGLPVDTYTEKRDSSAQGLLLLETLGLPREVAWFIVATTYWLL